jgi:predicted flap endonuclease-1-like 5' DNA nuclease
MPPPVDVVTTAPLPADPFAPILVEPVLAPVPPVVDTLPAEPEPGAPIEPAAPAPAGPADTDDLLRLKGVGPKLKALLIDLGITRYAQIAAWTDSDLATIDAQLGNFKGRPVRDHWVDQAKYLAAGDTAGFEAKYGKL